eukprot:NODE_152_length_2169_cov_171.342453_g125_i0.p1 GENE.NODE_152_length_2169_cov_171.342453_g125_i0~~NODE_152_length_2169_cov_171.342453_g125_i0.p1  ORF type:complete len:624 (+),score=118.70 NODE_152_length_2169_cov_171.342453_g125_i0:70-1941(+)
MLDSEESAARHRLESAEKSDRAKLHHVGHILLEAAARLEIETMESVKRQQLFNQRRLTQPTAAKIQRKAAFATLETAEKRTRVMLVSEELRDWQALLTQRTQFVIQDAQKLAIDLQTAEKRKRGGLAAQEIRDRGIHIIIWQQQMLQIQECTQRNAVLVNERRCCQNLRNAISTTTQAAAHPLGDVMETDGDRSALKARIQMEPIAKHHWSHSPPHQPTAELMIESLSRAGHSPPSFLRKTDLAAPIRRTAALPPRRIPLPHSCSQPDPTPFPTNSHGLKATGSPVTPKLGEQITQQSHHAGDGQASHLVSDISPGFANLLEASEYEARSALLQQEDQQYLRLRLQQAPQKVPSRAMRDAQTSVAAPLAAPLGPAVAVLVLEMAEEEERQLTESLERAGFADVVEKIANLALRDAQMMSVSPPDAALVELLALAEQKERQHTQSREHRNFADVLEWHTQKLIHSLFSAEAPQRVLILAEQHSVWDELHATFCMEITRMEPRAVSEIVEGESPWHYPTSPQRPRSAVLEKAIFSLLEKKETKQRLLLSTKLEKELSMLIIFFNRLVPKKTTLSPIASKGSALASSSPERIFQRKNHPNSGRGPKTQTFASSPTPPLFARTPSTF